MEYSKEMKEKMKDRLIRIIDKKIQTTMIFPIAEFEKEFGFLWGHEKEESSLNKEERLFRDKWKKCRNNILNLGNQQRRNSKAELKMHEVKWNRYETVFYPVNDKDNV
jgi:hypothetical protein